MKFADNHFDEVGHFYAPIPAFGGSVLKYQGIATEGNRAHLAEKHPQGVILQAYKGDRIRAADHSEFEPFGSNSKAYQLTRKSNEQIEAEAVRVHGSCYYFRDGSFIEWNRFGHHQAFLSNGRNVTPR
ncbi:MAG: hypothetical protein ACJ72N_07595 [Labedaea sp.]|jgi:hypothetical protein